VRYFVLLSLACAAILSYVLRVSLSPASTTVERELHLSELQVGRILGAFFVGYIILQIPAGGLARRIGARASLTAMGLCWAGAVATSAFAHSFGLLYLSRFALGLGQSGLFAVTIMVLRDWFPVARRGMASAAITSCMSVGAVAANGLTVRLLPEFGWRGTFLIYALAAVAWSLAFLAWFRNTPDEHPSVNEAERALIQGDAPPKTSEGERVADTSLSTWAVLGKMAVSWGVWALCIQSFFQAFGYAFYIQWFPAWLEKAHRVDLKNAGDLTMLPLFGSFLGSFLAGYLIDAILVRTGNRWLSRCGVAAAGLTLCAGATLAAAWVRDPSAAAVVIGLGMFFSGFAKPNQWAATMDLTGHYSAVGFAVMNVVGNVGALACPEVVGWMIAGLSKSGGDWNSVLYLIAGIHLAGAVVWVVLNPNRPAVESSPRN